MNFEDLERICIGLYGTAWQAQLANALSVDRRNIQNWKARDVPKWVFKSLDEIVAKRKSEVLFAEKHYLKLKEETRMKQLVHTEHVNDFVKVNFYCEEMALPSRSAKLSVDVECGAKTYTHAIQFKGDFNYFNQIPASARGATDIDCIKGDFKRLLGAEKLQIGTTEIIYEYLMLVRLAVYDALDVANNNVFKTLFAVDNMFCFAKGELKQHYDKVMLELAKLS